ncbi:hypothetical protein R1T16_14165 [Flavobacterium sp. DG1-102-2]|uniref:hypothetical protein n=1 Tax=Flavobacterium sp. DG1-102-2 TaxID=3081663 RepID=UPI00294A8EBF|nr:hypothetical protein [Flavobacterium sp. DG1-102-2]MDV6169577.1 hypothetical protein [Flavobacterium sp. DG1-102-2]
MALNRVVPYTTNDGINYLIKFSVFKAEVLPEQITLPVVEIIIETNSTHDNIYNDISTIKRLLHIVLEYIHENDVVFYFYCSNKPIKKSEKNIHLSHQEFRSNLFSAMFQLDKTNRFTNKLVIINDQDGNHYIHLITKIEFEETANLIMEELKKFDK